ncbi:S8 family serine peptidase [bacterium]|nr:S8 family serine peptidase [bacterium]
MAWFWNKKKTGSQPQKGRRPQSPNLHLEGLEERLAMDASSALSKDNFSNVVDLSRGNGVNFSSSLAQLYTSYENRTGSQFNISSLSYSDQYFYQGNRISISVSGNSSVTSMMSDLTKAGATDLSATHGKVSGWVSLDELQAVKSLTSISYVSWDLKPHLNVGPIVDPADTIMQANLARQTYNVTGAGITVGIISDSFNSDGLYPQDIIDGALPANVRIMSDAIGTDEGRAMAQLVHQLAPSANLVFYTAGTSKEEFAQAITDLAAAGCNVIVDDVIFFNEAFFQEDVVAQAVDQVTAQGVTYVSAAGNEDSQSWQQTFNPSGVYLQNSVLSELFPGINGQLNDFNPGATVDTLLPCIIAPESATPIIFNWDNSFASATGGKVGPTDDYGMFAVTIDDSGKVTLIAFSDDVNSFSGEAYEQLNIVNDDQDPLQFYIGIFNHGSTNNFIKSIWTRDVLRVFDFGENSVNHSTIWGHALAPGAIAVAAADAATPLLPESFTSVGGTPLLFDNDGNRIPANVQRKPNVTGIDGTDTTVPGFAPFFGTSAAAPHVAAVAALMLQAAPNSSPRAIRVALEQSAIDLYTPGFDFISGYGLVQADAAIGVLLKAHTYLMIDVSQSMVGTSSLDIDGDGKLTDADDLDHDGVKGTPLDEAIAIVNELNDQRFFLPNVSIIIFGKDAKFVDMSPTGGMQTSAVYTVGSLPNLDTIKVGSAGQYQTSVVNATRSYYDSPLNLVLSDHDATAYSEAVMITDGAGLLSASNTIVNSLAAAGITVNSYLVGHYYTVGSTTSIQRLANATQGNIAVDFTPVIVDNAVIRPTVAALPTFTVAINQFGSVVRFGLDPTPVGQVTPPTFSYVDPTKKSGSSNSSISSVVEIKDLGDEEGTDVTTTDPGTPTTLPETPTTGGSDSNETTTDPTDSTTVVDTTVPIDPSTDSPTTINETPTTLAAA